MGAGLTLPSLLQAFCRRFGSRTHLASVHSEEELQAVADLLFSRSGDASEEELDEEVWIGLHRPLRVSTAPGNGPEPPPCPGMLRGWGCGGSPGVPAPPCPPAEPQLAVVGRHGGGLQLLAPGVLHQAESLRRAAGRHG